MTKLADTMILPVAALIVAITFAAAGIKLTNDRADAAKTKLAAQEAQLREAVSRVQKSGAEKELIARHLPDYQRLQQQGFVGEEQRINWLDALRSANHKAGLFGVNYDIGVRQAYPNAALLNPGQMRVLQSGMKLRLPLLHEEDLLNFMEALREQNAGVYLIDQCAIRRSPGTQTTRFQPNMTAECQLSWLTAQPATAEDTRPPSK
jgi:hypothetical protein